jgi:hypothetical protein
MKRCTVMIIIFLLSSCSGLQHHSNYRTYSIDRISLIRMLSVDAAVKSDIRDEVYHIPLNPQEFINAIPDYKYNIPVVFHDKDSFDCDDRVRIFRGWLSEQGWGNVLIMDAAVIMNGRAHNLLAFISPDPPHILRYAEAMEKKIISFDVSKNFTLIKLIF